MAGEQEPSPNLSDFVKIEISGLLKSKESSEEEFDEEESDEEESDEEYKETVSLPRNTTLLALRDKIKDLGYHLPDCFQIDSTTLSVTATKAVAHPFEEIEVVEGQSSITEKCININERLIAFTNRQFGPDVKFNIDNNVASAYGTSMDVLKENRGLEISFHRTIRMPDDDKLHQLPGSLGTFPLFSVKAYSEQLPDKITQLEGVFLPMWQREALWMNFSAPYGQEYALRVFIGHINAVSGLQMDEEQKAIDGMSKVQDYVVIPGQEWLDGICVSSGVVRQFVAMPLGSGYTVEGQKTQEEKYGGLQIEIIPSFQRRLRTWFREPLETSKLPAASTNFGWGDNLDEYRTPSELRLNSGEKIRCYPSIPTYDVPFEVNDLPENAHAIKHIRVMYSRIPQAGRKKLWESEAACAEARKPTPPKRKKKGRVCGSKQRLAVEDASMSQEASNPDIPDMPEPTILSSHFCDSSMPSLHSLQPNNEDLFTNNIVAKDLKAMGIAAGGKLVQDIYRDRNPAYIWNTEAARVMHIHILDPSSCEKATRLVPPPPPIDMMEYVDANLPFFVVEEQVDNRVTGGDFDNVKSVSAKDKEKGVAKEQSLDPSKPKACEVCQTRLCDCIVRPCDHEFCNVCIKAAEPSAGPSNSQFSSALKCPSCWGNVSYVARFSAPMNVPGEESVKIKAPIHVLKVEDGRVQFKSIQRTRI